MPERNGTRALVRGVGLLLCIAVAVLCAAEALLRATEHPQRQVSDGTYGPYRFDAELGWLAPPNSTGVQPSTNRTVSLQHNSLGIRERELSDIAADRILFLGDSFTWGYDAEVDERFTNLLQRALPQYGMVNAGIAGYGTDQQFLLMERLWSQVNPKVVVVTFCVDNDRDDNSSNIRYRQHKPYFVRTLGGALKLRGYPLQRSGDDGSLLGAWTERLALVRFVDSIRAKMRYREYVAREILVPDPTEHLIDMMQRTVEARGARLVLGLQRHEPRLEAHLQARHIPYTTFDGAPAYPTAGWHWTPEGNAQVAKAYLALFAEIGLLQNLSAQASGHVAPADIAFGRDQPPAETASVLSPSTWLTAARALPDKLSGLGRFLTSWLIAVSDSGGEPRVAVALLIVAALGVALLLLWFWWERRVPIAARALGRSERALASFGVFFVLALPMTLSTLILLEAAQVRMIEITYGLVAGIFVAAFGRAVALGLFAPDAPQRRLIAMDDATARSLCSHLVWATRGLGALILLLAIHKALAAPMALTVATNMLFALVVGALLLHLLVSQAHGGGAWKGLPHASLVWALGWLILATIAIALVAGYPAVATLVAAGLVSIVMVAGALYLVVTLGRAMWAERIALDTPRSEAIAANFGVSPRLLGLAVVLTYGAMCLAIALGALVLYIAAPAA